LKLINEGRDLSSDELKPLLQKHADSIIDAHKEAARGHPSVSTLAPNPLFNFVVLIQRKGKLLELDCSLRGAIDHGQTSEASFVSDAATVFRQIVGDNSAVDCFCALAIHKTNKVPIGYNE
jgi:hypothetical protein